MHCSLKQIHQRMLTGNFRATTTIFQVFFVPQDLFCPKKASNVDLPYNSTNTRVPQQPSSKGG